MERMISIRRMVFRTVLIQRVVVERMVQKVVSYNYCTFALIKMTSELHIDVMKQQPGFQVERAQRGCLLSNQAIAAYDTQRKAVRQTLLKLD